MNINTEGRHASVLQLEDQLFSVLSRHYFVNGQTFNQISPIDMVKHEICHLVKALQKIQRACEERDKEAIDIVIKELMPDLVIYALEIAIAFDVQWFRDYKLTSINDSDDLLSFLTDDLATRYNKEVEMLCDIRRKLILAVSKFGHFCDKHDHRQDSGVNLGSDVVSPFFVAACSISKFYDVSLATLYRQRLVFVENKYVGQPDFHVKLVSQAEKP